MNVIQPNDLYHRALETSITDPQSHALHISLEFPVHTVLGRAYYIRANRHLALKCAACVVG